jgi:hypothetical protein
MARKHIEYYALSLAAFGDRIIPKENETEGSVYRGWQGQNFMHQISKRFIDGVEAIKAKYKPDAQPKEIQKLAGELLQQIPAAVSKFLQPLAASYYEMKNQVAKISIGPSSDPAAMIRRMEIRTHLKSIDGKERLRIFQEAVENGDNEIAGAYLESHKIFNLLDENTLAAGREKLLRKRDPLLADAFFAASRAGSILSGNFRHVIEELGVYAPPIPGEIFTMLESLPKADWKDARGAEGRFIDNNLLPSALPKPTMEFKK